MRFQATVQLSGKTATGISVPEDVVLGLGGGRRPAVSVTLGGHTYRSTIAPMRGAHMIPISAEIRGITGVAAGDDLDVEVTLDTAPREVVVPGDFAAALDGLVEARRAFDALSFSRKRALVDSVQAAKTDETRQRRIGKAVTALAATAAA